MNTARAILFYQSTEPLNATSPLAGLKFVPNSVLKETNFTDGITICGRFNYRLLSVDSAIYRQGDQIKIVKNSQNSQK